MSGSNQIYSLNVPGADNTFGTATDISSLVGKKTFVLAGTYIGKLIVYGSHDGTNYTPIVTFDSGIAVQQTKVSKDLILRFLKVKREASVSSIVTIRVVGQEACSANSFLAFPTVAARAEGSQASFDTWGLIPPTGISPGASVMVFGKFNGSIVIEGSLDNINFAPLGVDEQGVFVGGFNSSPSTNNQSIQLAPIIIDETTRYLRARVGNNTYVVEPLTITLGGETNESCSSDGDGSLVFENVAALITAGSAGSFNNQTATLLGYYTKSDEGGGQLYWNAASVAAADNRITFAVSGTVTGRWIRILSLSNSVVAEEFGAVGDGTVDDTLAVQAVLDAGFALRFISSKTYLTGSINLRTGSRICGNFAILKNGRLVGSNTISDFAVEDLRMVDTTSDLNTFFLNIDSTRFLLQNIFLEKIPSAGGYVGYLQPNSSFGIINGLRSSGSNGVFISGHDHTINSPQMESVGGDDCFVVKAPGTQTYNIVINSPIVKNYTSILSVGSEIGTPGADSNFTSFARNIVVNNGVAYNCTFLLFIKPGSINGIDYRNGLVEDVLMNNCTLADPAGTNFQMGFHIIAGRGSMVRNVRMNNCSVRARASNQAVTRTAMTVRIVNEGNPATIKQIFLNDTSIIDEYQGQTNDPTRPGNPIDVGVFVETATVGVGVIEQIYANNLLIDGTRFGALFVGEGLDGAVSFNDNECINICNEVTPTVSGLSIKSNGIETLRNKVSVVNNKPVGSVLFTTIEYNGEQETVFFGTVAAGATSEKCMWTAPVNCYVWKIEVINTSAIAQSNADYTTLLARNMATANVMVQRNTTIATGMNVLASTPTRMLATDQVNNDCYLTKGTVVRFEKADTGAGRATNEMYAVIHYVKY